MNKSVLKNKIKSFCYDVGFAVAVTTLAIIYGLTVFAGAGLWWLFIIDIFLSVIDWCIVSRNWKSLKAMLEESE